MSTIILMPSELKVKEPVYPTEGYERLSDFQKFNLVHKNLIQIRKKENQKLCYQIQKQTQKKK